MSYLTSSYVDCEIIQSMIEDQFVTCPTPQESMPAMEAILATQKAAGIAQSVSDGNGKVKNVRVIYNQRLLESAVTEGSGTRGCSTEVETFDKSQIYDIDPAVWLRAEEKFSTSSLSTVCYADVQSMIAKKISLVMDVLERKAATQTAEQLVLAFGNWGANVSGTVNGSDELVLAQYVSAATKVIDYSSMPTLDLALMQTGYCAPAIIVGGSALYHYNQFINNGCCAATGVNVLDIANEFGKAIMYDKRVTTALGSELKSIAFQAGSVAIITYNEASQVPNLGANYAKMKMFTPRLGLPVDIVLSDVCGTISVLGFMNLKLVTLPSDLFAIGDEYAGVNYVNKILITNPA